MAMTATARYPRGWEHKPWRRRGAFLSALFGGGDYGGLH